MRRYKVFALLKLNTNKSPQLDNIYVFYISLVEYKR